jgi:hypothetical protein
VPGGAAPGSALRPGPPARRCARRSPRAEGLVPPLRALPPPRPPTHVRGPGRTTRDARATAARSCRSPHHREVRTDRIRPNPRRLAPAPRAPRVRALRPRRTFLPLEIGRTDRSSRRTRVNGAVRRRTRTSRTASPGDPRDGALTAPAPPRRGSDQGRHRAVLPDDGRAAGWLNGGFPADAVSTRCRSPRPLSPTACGAWGCADRLNRNASVGACAIADPLPPRPPRVPCPVSPWRRTRGPGRPGSTRSPRAARTRSGRPRS